jgi:hypothetical protein
MTPRPKEVPIIAGFLFAAAGIAVIIGASLLFPNRLADRLWELNKPGAALFRSFGWISGIFLLLVGAGSCAGAIGMLRRKKWAWWFAVGLFTIDGAGDMISLLMTGDWPRSVSGAAISFGFLYVLCRRRVRAYFEQT